MNLHNSFSWLRILAVVAACGLGQFLFASVARAQEVPPPEMCGDGTTFTVDLPSLNPTATEDDSITLPKGCRIYMLVVSDFGRNHRFDELLLYPTAKFVAENNGYVHWAWWNNLLKPYKGRSQHREASMKEPHPGVLLSIGNWEELLGVNFIGGEAVDELIEAQMLTDILSSLTPVKISLVLLALETILTQIATDQFEVRDDNQFVADAAEFIRAVKREEPNALIILAGHGYGGHGVIKVSRRLQEHFGFSDPQPIDLMAVIDPVGNSKVPGGFQRLVRFIPKAGVFLKFLFGSVLEPQTQPESRWRVVNDFFGYRQADCIRQTPTSLFCKDVDPRFFFVRFACEPLGRAVNTPTTWLDDRPLIPTRAPLVCPSGPIIHTGKPIPPLRNVGFLYHVWQKENVLPEDFPFDRPIPHPAPLSDAHGPNWQRNAFDLICRVSFPPAEFCSLWDGHDELVGFRGVDFLGLSVLGVPQATLIQIRNRDGVRASGDWPLEPNLFLIQNSAERQNLFALLGDLFPNPPANPERCAVCNDLNQIIASLLQAQPADEDLTPPSSTASIAPLSNENGWNNSDVVVTLAAADNVGGSGVQEIEFSLSGAHVGGPSLGGAVVDIHVANEGTTNVNFFARDNSGNVETPEKSVSVNLDLTPPSIEALPSPAPNAFGWNNRDVSVSFTASDALSGLAEVSPMDPVLVTTEGADQEIIGTATDLAGNQSAAAAVVSLDKTAPEVAGAPDRSPDSNGWYNHLLTVTWDCADGLSGVQSFSAPADYNGPDSAAASVSGMCFDFAENEAGATVDFQFDATPPGINIATPADGAIYLLNAAVNSAFDCSDNLSGVDTCVGPVASGAAIDTATVNDKQFTVNSSDVAANHATRTHSYSVHYDYSGPFSPLQALPVVNVVKAGRTVPFKYRLQDANGVLVSDLSSFVSLQSAPVACTDSSFTDLIEETAEMTGETTVRYDSTANQFVINWQTSSGWTGCRVLQLKLDDGTEHFALFQFK